jgi:hypothetical protein
MTQGNQGLGWLARAVAAMATGGRSCAAVFCTDRDWVPAFARWLGAHCCPILVVDPRESLTATYLEMKALAHTGSIGEIDTVTVARSGAASAGAAFDRLATTAARFLPLEVRRLATLDGRELDALGEAPRAGAASPHVRIGRALAGALSRRWPELAMVPPTGRAPALRERLTA